MSKKNQDKQDGRGSEINKMKSAANEAYQAISRGCQLMIMAANGLNQIDGGQGIEAECWNAWVLPDILQNAIDLIKGGLEELAQAFSGIEAQELGSVE